MGISLRGVLVYVKDPTAKEQYSVIQTSHATIHANGWVGIEHSDARGVQYTHEYYPPDAIIKICKK